MVSRLPCPCLSHWLPHLLPIQFRSYTRVDTACQPEGCLIDWLTLPSPRKSV